MLARASLNVYNIAMRDFRASSTAPSPMIRTVHHASLLACIASLVAVLAVIISARALDAKTFSAALSAGLIGTLATGTAVVATYRD